jgi:hypothetical protein
MASNYNGACRPAVVWLKEGAAYVVQEREKLSDLYRRDKLVRAGQRGAARDSKTSSQYFLNCWLDVNTQPKPDEDALT